MGRLGGMWAGVSAGLDSIIEGNKARDERALRERSADLAERNLGLQEQRLGMEKDLHGFKLDAEKRKNEELDVDEIGKAFGSKDPAAFEYGLDHAMRNGYIKVNKDTGKRTIRREDLGNTMKHLDTAEGVAEISKRNIMALEDQLSKITDPAQRAPLEKRLQWEKVNNKGALEYMKMEETAKQKRLDRESHEKVARINKAPAGESAGQKAYREAMTEKLRAETNILKNGGKLDDKAFEDLSKYMTSDTVYEELRSIKDPNEREMRREQMISEYLNMRTGGRRLGGSAATAGSTPGSKPRRKITYNPANGRYE